MTPIDTCVARIATLRRQRADVRRSITVLESLVLHHDTKTVGMAADDVLRAAERRLTELLNREGLLLRRAKARMRDDFVRLAALGGAS